MDVAERLDGLALMARNMKKIAPNDFGIEPVSGFIDALANDLENVAKEWLAESDD